MARDAREATAARLRAAIEMFETGVQMMRQTLRRRDPTVSDAELDRQLTAWLRERPGAEFGDATGRPVTWPRRGE
jgi:signal transduction histidine kinase